MAGSLHVISYICMYMYVCVFIRVGYINISILLFPAKSINPIFPQSFSQLSHLFTHTPLTHSVTHKHTKVLLAFCNTLNHTLFLFLSCSRPFCRIQTNIKHYNRMNIFVLQLVIYSKNVCISFIILCFSTL